MPEKKSGKPAKETAHVQELFFANLKRLMPQGLSVADEVAELLNVSLDGAYRRLRGETGITIDEIAKVMEKYPVPLEEIMGKQGGAATFSYTKLTDSEENFIGYFNRLHDQLIRLSAFQGSKIYYVADEVPVFYSFGSDKLTEFKLFFWQRSVLNIEKYQRRKFDWGVVPRSLVEIARESSKEYMNIPSVEIWNDQTVLTNIKQIRYYFESGLVTKADALELMLEHRSLVERVHQMADNARKNISDNSETFQLYTSELVLGTNCIYALMGDKKYSYISFNSVNSLSTSNADFCEETESWLRNLEKKSTVISGIGEKHRFQFFTKMYSVIDASIESIERAQPPS